MNDQFGLSEQLGARQIARRAEDSAEILRPMRIGEILDRSMRLVKRIFPGMLPVFLVLSLLRVLGSSERMKEHPVALGIVGLTSLIVSIPLSYVVTFIASDLWLNRACSVGGAFRRCRLRHYLRTFAVGLIIMVLPFTLAVTAASLAFPLLGVIPGVLVSVIALVVTIVFAVNRMLAYYIVLVEDASVGMSLRRSKFLMTQSPWYSLSGPAIRVSGLLLITTLVAIAIGALANGSLAAAVAGGSLYLEPAKALLVFFGSLLQSGVLLFSTSAIVGFYYDLRVRYEAFDLSEGGGPQAGSPGAALQL